MNGGYNQNSSGFGRMINTSPDDPGKMFVGGLSWETTEEKLEAYFKQFGEVKDVSIKRDMTTQQSRGFGFVLFENPESVEKVVLKSEHLLDNKNIDPKRARALRKDNKLFVGGLSPDTTEETIRTYFGNYGEIDCIERPRDRNTQKFRGFCFIAFAKDGLVKEIIAESKFHTIDGRQCEVKDGDNSKRQRQQQGGYQSGYQQQGQYDYSQWQMAQAQQWYGAYGGGYGGGNGYDYNSGYGGYGGYGGGYGGYGGGYGGQQAGYGGYGGYGNQGGQGGGQGGPPQNGAGAANSGGKSKSAGRGSSNFKPY